MYGQKKLKSLRQGQSRFQAVVYDPGKIEGYDNEYVALVSRCFITKVRGNTVFYDTDSGPYLCHRQKFLEMSQPTYRAAVRQAKQLIEEAVSKPINPH